MTNQELENIWRAQDDKLDQLLTLNKSIAIDLSRSKLDKQISRLYWPKWTGLIIGIPYTLLLIAITVIASLAKAYFVAIGFGTIAALMIILLISYAYQLNLISQIKNSEEVLTTQQQLAKLRISSYNCLCLSIFQLPFWSLCWVSLGALQESPFIYGGVNLLIFSLLSYISYWLYYKISYRNTESKLRDFFLSGAEWNPIVRSGELLDQIVAYENS